MWEDLKEAFTREAEGVWCGSRPTTVIRSVLGYQRRFGPRWDRLFVVLSGHSRQACLFYTVLLDFHFHRDSLGRVGSFFLFLFFLLFRSRDWKTAGGLSPPGTTVGRLLSEAGKDASCLRMKHLPLKSNLTSALKWSRFWFKPSLLLDFLWPRRDLQAGCDMGDVRLSS